VEADIKVIQLTEAEDGQVINMAQADRLNITLPENPTTGYRWEISGIDAAVLRLEKSTYALGPHGAPGGGGIRTISFQGLSPGTSSLVLKLWRSWVGDPSVIRRFGVIINVQ
jgi:inhibitor of cysteine peptidase